MLLQCGTRTLECSQPKVMGVLNTTPDSFFDGGSLYRDGQLQLDAVLDKAKLLVDSGADIIDVGGESTRPGAVTVALQEEMDRVLPVVDAIVSRFDVIVSVDSSSPELFIQAARLGAGMINDVRALMRPGAVEAAVASGLAVCLMHMRGEPESMQDKPEYSDAVAMVTDFLLERVRVCEAAGLSRANILVDPGIGFGKTDEHNLALLRNLRECQKIAPVLLGVSRKSMFGRLLGRPLEKRLAGSLAVALMACQQGVSILRVHDVAETKDVIKMWQYLKVEATVDCELLHSR